jgi:hypothetical protein
MSCCLIGGETPELCKVYLIYMQNPVIKWMTFWSLRRLGLRPLPSSATPPSLPEEGGWLVHVGSDNDDGPRLLTLGAGGLASNSCSTMSTSLTGSYGSRSSPVMMCQGWAGTTAAGISLTGHVNTSTAARSSWSNEKDGYGYFGSACGDYRDECVSLRSLDCCLIIQIFRWLLGCQIGRILCLIWRP